MVFLIILLFYLFIPFIHAQDNEVELQLNKITWHIDSFNLLYPQEKVYIHFDNTCYFLGDTIWFKAYVRNALFHQPMDWSGTLYVELLTQEGETVTTRKLKVTNGECPGEIPLTGYLKSSYYEVRAYTRWMTNGGEDIMFSRVFPVFDAPSYLGDYKEVMTRQRASIPDYRKKNFFKQWEKKGERLKMDFYPEGGNLVLGIKSKVAFKAIDRDGKDAEVRGQITDSKGNIVTYFSSIHNGMGVFDLEPDNNPYYAEVEYEKRKYKFKLPVSVANGCVIRTDLPENNELKIRLMRSESLNKESLGITVTCRGKVYASEILPALEEQMILRVPLNTLPTGIIQINVFTMQGDILCERLVFVNHGEQVKINYAFSKEVYSPFEKVNLDFQLTDSQDNPLHTNFSLSVRDADKSINNNQGDNILTNLLLASDLKGYIHNPGYYFENDSRSRRMALDLLLMVQGWSRYVWKQMAGFEPLKIDQPAEEFVSIDGNVYLYVAKQHPRKDVDVFLWMLNEEKESYRANTTTDDEGRFIFSFDVYDEWEVNIQITENNKRKNSDIRLNRFFGPDPRPLTYYEKQFSNKKKVEKVEEEENVEEINEEFFEMEIDTTRFVNHSGRMLEEVMVKARKITPREEVGLKYASVIYDMEPFMDRLIDTGEDKAIDVFDFLHYNNPFYGEINRKGEWIKTYKSRPIVFVINNREETEVGTILLNELTVEEIKLITIDESPGAACAYIISPNCSDYVVVFIYTYEDNSSRKGPKGIRKTHVQGYHRVKEFYSPDYSKGIMPDEVDYRRTLYWNPNVQTGHDGKASVEFYNSSTCRKMEVSAETVTTKGLIGTTDQIKKE
ncbi:MAG: hypothetical protein LIO65_00565 [Odoribacter sp.]|nr:hypothetical protein [Odoribacter sp.]